MMNLFNSKLKLLAGGVVILALILLWQPVSKIGADPATIRNWVQQAGPLAPLAFFLLNVIQIVAAPIPGYPVQVLGGILFGFIPGAIYTVGGMVAGGVLAAWLGRRLGRPWLANRVGAETLDQWARIGHINSFWTWWIILLIPLGDIPYFFAGLSRIPLSRFALAILASRGPFTVVIVWAGDRVTQWPLAWIALLLGAIGLIVLVGFSQRERIEKWGRAYLAHHAAAKANSPDSSTNS